MKYRKPIKINEDELRHGSICQYCGVKMVEDEGEVYHTTHKGWMCESCYLGNQKPHCLPRPYKRVCR